MTKFLWSDGLGNWKWHCVKWEWCCMARKLVGLGTRDLKVHGIALSSRWVIKFLKRNKPWRLMVENNTMRFINKKGNKWKGFLICHIVTG